MTYAVFSLHVRSSLLADGHIVVGDHLVPISATPIATFDTFEEAEDWRHSALELIHKPLDNA